MSRNVVITISVDGKDRETHKAPYGARIRVKDGDPVKKGQRLAEWDPYTRPILTEVEGTVAFEDLVEGLSVKEETDEATGIAQRVVSDWRASPRGSDLRPAMGVTNGDAYAKLSSGSDARYLLPVGAVLSVANGDEVKPGEIIARVPTEGAKTRDITGGLPRVAELFEARSPKDAGMLAEVTGTVSFGKDTKGKQRLVITDLDGNAHEFLIPKEKHVLVHDGQVVNKGEMIVDGPADPHDILRLLGIEALSRYIVDEVQDVYRLQGVKINDKHIEVIVRQMLRRVVVTAPGGTNFIVGEQVERSELLDATDKMNDEGKLPPSYENILLGITKASLSTDSFISAASFQETTRVLTEAAIMGKRDDLRGLKENVIVGRLIPAGTGLAYHKARHDKESVEAQEAAALAAAEAAFAIPSAPEPELVTADEAVSAPSAAATAAALDLNALFSGTGVVPAPEEPTAEGGMNTEE